MDYRMVYLFHTSLFPSHMREPTRGLESLVSHLYIENGELMRQVVESAVYLIDTQVVGPRLASQLSLALRPMLTLRKLNIGRYPLGEATHLVALTDPAYAIRKNLHVLLLQHICALLAIPHTQGSLTDLCYSHESALSTLFCDGATFTRTEHTIFCKYARENDLTAFRRGVGTAALKMQMQLVGMFKDLGKRCAAIIAGYAISGLAPSALRDIKHRRFFAWFRDQQARGGNAGLAG